MLLLLASCCTTSCLACRFELAVQLGELEVALDIAETADSEGKWRQLSELAMSTGKLEVSSSHSSAQLQSTGCLTMGTGGWGNGTPRQPLPACSSCREQAHLAIQKLEGPLTAFLRICGQQGPHGGCMPTQASCGAGVWLLPTACNQQLSVAARLCKRDLSSRCAVGWQTNIAVAAHAYIRSLQGNPCLPAFNAEPYHV